MSKEELLETIKNLKLGESLTVDDHELSLCEELKKEGRVDFKAVPKGIGEDGKNQTELCDPIFLG